MDEAFDCWSGGKVATLRVRERGRLDTLRARSSLLPSLPPSLFLPAHNPTRSFAHTCLTHAPDRSLRAVGNLIQNNEDYHLYFADWWRRDVRSMVMRDRNHPSVRVSKPAS